MTETSNKNNQAERKLNEEVLELMNDKGVNAPYLACSLVNLFKPQNKSRFKFIKDQISIGMNIYSINTNVRVTLYSIMVTFRDTNKSFELDGYLLKTKTNDNFNVGHSNLQDQKTYLEFGKEMKFEIKQKGRTSDRDKCLLKLLESPAIMSSGTSTVFF